MKVKLTVLTLLVVGLVLGLSGSAFANLAVTAPAQIAASVDVPNATDEIAILSFTLTADAAEDLTELVFIEGVNANIATITAADAISDLVVYEDGAVVGAFEETDTAIAGTYDAGTLTYTFDAAEVFANTDTKDYIVVVELSGAAETDDIIAIDLDASASTTTNILDADAVGNGMTVVALDVVAVTQDVTGPPYNRPNGYLDSIMMTFDQDVDDSTVDAADFMVGALAGDFIETFTSTFNSDVAGDDKIYIQIDESVITDATPAVAYAAGSRILSADGQYGLPDTDIAAVTDAAPPAPRSVTTLDTDGNGKLDLVEIQFSEALVNGTSQVGMTIAGYAIASAAAVDPADGSDFAGLASLWQLTITEGDDYDTGTKPNYSYDNALNLLSDGTNQVATFNQLNVPVTDGAAPTVVAAMTWDLDDDGMFDALSIDFSEYVALMGGATVDDLDGDTTGFNFNGIFDTTYDFATSGHTLDGSRIIMQVNELGSFDTAVQPVIEYNAGSSLIRDLAATPNALVAQVPFTNVSNAASVTAAAEIWMQDNISARITSATWYDDDANGQLDNIQLVFSEPMGTTASTYNSLVIAEHAIESVSVAGATVTIEVDETGYDTGMTPDVTYASDTIFDANGAPLMELTSETINELDGAYPIAYSIETQDTAESSGSGDRNGMIDGILVRFSENLDNTFLDSDAGSELKDEWAVTGYTVSDASLIRSGSWRTGYYYNSMMIEITESGSPDTDATPEVTYGALGDSSIVDLNGLMLQDIGAGQRNATDTSDAEIIAAVTVDNNIDGYLDGIHMTFSEDVSIASADTAKILAAVTLEEVANAIDLSAATITAPASNQLMLVGSSGMGVENWDTGETPLLSIAGDNGISDAADNITAAISDIATADGAVPIIGKAMGQVGSTDISIWFSEAVTNDVGAAIDETDIMYWSASSGVAIESINDAGDADGSTFVAVTDSNLTLNHVTNDMIRVVENAIVDASPAQNVAPADTVGIIDAVAPVLLEAHTMDANSDGLIDNIKMVFSEAIKEENTLGWAGGKSDSSVSVYLTGNGFDDIFTVPGFEVIGYNFTSTAANASAATTRLLMNSVIKGNQTPVANVGDVTGDAILYLMVYPDEEPENGDTAITPTLSFLGGADYAGIGDYSPNYAADVTDFQVEDGAPPLIVSAMMDPESEGTIMTFTVTESYEADLPPAAPAFEWLVGTEMVDYGTMGFMVNFEPRPGDETGRVYNIEIATSAVPPLTESTLAYRAPGMIEDAAGVPNIVVGPIDVTPWEVIVGVEEEDETDVPDVYALSKNFPNPFNPTTSINYDIAGNGGHVSLVIYNMTGQKVRTLVDEVKAPGYYSAIWDGTNERGENVASGIYLYKLMSGSFSKIEKMTFVK